MLQFVVELHLLSVTASADRWFQSQICTDYASLSATKCITDIMFTAALIKLTDLQAFLLSFKMTSVERILSYNKLAQEGPMESDRPPPDTWPMQGTISFSDTSLRYEDNLPYALKHINFHIKSKEKVSWKTDDWCS